MDHASPIPQRILIVEDNLTLGAMLLSELQAHGYGVAAVTGAEAGMRSLENDQIDLIILDILLPRMNGLDFLQEIRRRNFRQPVMVVSNMGDADIKERALALGAAHYLVKANSTPEEIIGLARSVLSGQSAAKRG